MGYDRATLVLPQRGSVHVSAGTTMQRPGCQPQREQRRLRQRLRQ